MSDQHPADTQHEFQSALDFKKLLNEIDDERLAQCRISFASPRHFSGAFVAWKATYQMDGRTGEGPYFIVLSNE